MKYLIASDIHGSAFYAKKVVEKFKEEKADKLILLGDIYNHGPRNPLPKDYAPLKVAEILNGLKDNLIVIKGNCDSAVDTMISEFEFFDNLLIAVGGKTMFLTHGHVFNKDNLPKTKVDAIVYGHFHTGFVEESNGIISINVGSVSLPKNQTANSYLIIDENSIELKDFDGNIIAKTCL